VPRQYSTGGKAKPLGISKRGERLFVQGSDLWCKSGGAAFELSVSHEVNFFATGGESEHL